MIEIDRSFAIVTVDVQNDFCPGGALGVANGNKIITKINEVNALAEEKGALRIATRDWHSPIMEEHFKIWPVHCVQDTPGAEFHPELETEGFEIFSKGMNPKEHGYSPFEGRNEQGQSLNEYLQREGIVKVVFLGIATEHCVKAGAMGAVAKERRYETFLTTDAIAAVNAKAGDEERAIKDMQDAGVILIGARDMR